MRAPDKARLHHHLRGEGVGALLEAQALQQVEPDGAERPVVAQAQAEEDEEIEGQPVVAQTLVQRHPAGGGAVHGPAARADDQVGLVGENGTDEVAHLRRVVGPVRLHEDDGAGAAGGGGAGAGEARIAVASPRFAQQRPAGRGDQLGAAVGRAVVDEERAARADRGRAARPAAPAEPRPRRAPARR